MENFSNDYKMLVVTSLVSILTSTSLLMQTHVILLIQLI